MTDPFADPIIPPSTHPTIGSFRGRLVMITPVKTETVQDNLNPGKMVERVTANVTVVDGLGPVPVVKGNPPQPTGQTLPGPDFTGMWIQSERIVTQVRDFVGTGRVVLGVIDTRNPGTNPGKGNPWGVVAATEAQKQTARNFLATRTIGAAVPPTPAPVAPQQGAYTAAVTAAPAQIPAPVGSPSPAVPAPGSAPVGVNPFA